LAWSSCCCYSLQADPDAAAPQAPHSITLPLLCQILLLLLLHLLCQYSR
jgi:hypothetical protein